MLISVAAAQHHAPATKASALLILPLHRVPPFLLIDYSSPMDGNGA
jgi:hypothetical protein